MQKNIAHNYTLCYTTKVKIHTLPNLRNGALLVFGKYEGNGGKTREEKLCQLYQ